MRIIEFNSTKCKHCYKCVRNCTVKAIAIRNERAEIIGSHCILCGRCLQVCPQSAKTLSSELGEVKAMIAAGQKVVLTLAPSYVGLLKYRTIGQVRNAMMRLGFADVAETSEGAAVVTREYVRLIREGKMENIITTCCPSVNNLIEMYHPSLVKYLAPVVSPMIASGMLIKRRMPGVKVVFAGPCIAKKREARDPRHAGYIDAVLTFEDLESWLAEKHIDIGTCDDTPFTMDPSINRLYPVTGGVLKSVRATLFSETRNHPEEQAKSGVWDAQRPDGTWSHYRKFYVHGAQDCIDLCHDMEAGGVSGCFIEMNMCADGCIKGPAVDDRDVYKYKIKLDMSEAIPKQAASEETVRRLMEGLDFAKTFEDRSLHDPVPTEEQIREILAKIGKFRPEDELNCGACGYRSCRDKAIAVFQGKAELDMCIPYMHQKAESMANMILQESPNAVIMVSRDLQILEYSDIGEKFFGVSRADALTKKLGDLFDPSGVQRVFETGVGVHGCKVAYPAYGLITLQNIVYIPKQDCVLMTITDITGQEKKAREEYENRLHYMNMAGKVIREQMITAQKIASLLGETTAETKTTLTRLCDSIRAEGDGMDDQAAESTDAGILERAEKGGAEKKTKEAALRGGAADQRGTAGTDGKTVAACGPDEKSDRETEMQGGQPVSDAFRLDGLNLDVAAEKRNPANPVKKYHIVEKYQKKG